MIRFALRRLAASLLLVYLVLTATFFFVHLAPGEPAALLVEDRRIPESQREALRELYGLDKPLAVQYVRWLEAAADGSWGISFTYREPVTRVIARHLPATLALALAALAVEQAVGIGLGVAAARRAGSRTDHAIRIVSLVLYSQPVFWTGLVAILLFSQTWRILPSGMMRSTGAQEMSLAWQTLDLLRHLILPALVLGLSLAGSLSRYARGSVLDVLGQEHILAARARGLSERRVIWVHALRSALAPLFQLLALSLSGLLSGALVTEVVFSWPGLGQIAWGAILGRDYPLILGTTALTAILVIAANLLADGMHALADPRVREDHA